MKRAAVLVCLAMGCQVGEVDTGDAGAGFDQASSTGYFYDLAEYMAPDCQTPVNLTFPAAWGRRRYVPMGVACTGPQAGLARWVYVKNMEGTDFEEYTADPQWIRIWSDTSWAYEVHDGSTGSDPPYCDEQCGAHGVPTVCKREWTHQPAAYAYQAPRDADSSALGAPFAPRYLTRDDRPHAVQVHFFIDARQRASCAACDHLDSWHAASEQNGPAQTGTAVFQHVASYRNFTDLYMRAVTAGPGTGDRFWYARGLGFVGFQQVSGPDPTSLSAPLSHDDVALGTDGAGTVLPSRACFGFAQGATCAALGASHPPVGQNISIRANANGKTVCADDLGRSPLIANRPAFGGEWEKFRVVDEGGGMVGLVAYANNQAVCADQGGASPLVANRPGVGGAYEIFRWVELGGNRFALQSAANGKYVTAENGGNAPLIANRDAIGPWETFFWDPH